MKIINPVFKAHIEDQSVTRTTGRYQKKLYVGIVNSVERITKRYEEHSGKFGQIILLSLQP